MHVAFAADGRCVAEPGRGLLDSRAEVALGLSRTVEALKLIESHCR